MRAETYLASLEQFGIKLGLERITFLLERLGNPQDSFRSLQIAGTNGKGSTAAMLASILKEAGYKTGLYTSPHIFTYRERIKVNGRDISPADFERLALKIKKIADGMQDPPTIFELLTAAALEYFRQKRVRVAVLETGLGGRFDATTAVNPLLAVITQIAYDHTEVLGRSLSQIAFEKAGVIKEKGEVVVGEVPPGALKVIKRAAKEKKARVFPALGFQKAKRAKEEFGLPLLGRHQVRNLAVVLAVVQRLRARGWRISAKALKQGVQRVRWPLRFQVFCRKPLIILDAAHNPSGISALVQTIQDLGIKPPRVFYFGALRNKDYKAMLRQLARVADGFLVSAFSHPRACPAAELLRTVQRISALPAQRLALQKSLAQIKRRFAPAAVFVTGSIYFVSEFLKSAAAVDAGRGGGVK